MLVTGPTGSGKTTTLYASLGRVDTSTTNVLTVEDPVEYELAGIRPDQVNPRSTSPSPKALRAILRQDPDVIMIGEIRDFETAQIAIQASLTGHRCWPRCTASSPSCCPELAAGRAAQRLVRKLCRTASARTTRPLAHPVGCANAA